MSISGTLSSALSGLTANAKAVAGQNILHFGNVGSGAQVTSPDTFTILVDRTVSFDFSSLRWTFLTPSANPGPNQTVPVGTTVTLNGSGSTNPSGDGPLTYSWAFASKPAGSGAVLTNPASTSPTFTVDVAGNYVVTLTVANSTSSDSASVIVSTSNSPPVAKAGPNQKVALGSTVILNGSGSSDVDGDPLTYFWTIVSQPAGSTAFVGNFRTVTASFLLDKAGTYIVQLIVNDGKVDSAPSMVTTVLV